MKNMFLKNSTEANRKFVITISFQCYIYLIKPLKLVFLSHCSRATGLMMRKNLASAKYHRFISSVSSSEGGFYPSHV